MIIEYEKEYLSELYDIGQYIREAYTYNPIVVARYKVRVDALAAASNLKQLAAFRTWDVRLLAEEGHFSVRLDYSYRLLFKIKTPICILLDIIEQE